jgi:peptidoglycan/xylan/chitin deacetylase (PgdA/CDA1 family)
MAVHQVAAKDIFLPAFEWYNDSIAAWCREMNVTLINFTPGTLSHADYTLDTARNFLDSNIIFQSIMDREQKGNGLNGFILLMHLGAGPGRTDKFFYLLPGLLKELQAKNYQFQTIEELLKPN